MSSIYIEEAVIVETYEKEPKRSVEVVRPEVISGPRSRHRKRKKSLFDDFFNIGSIFDEMLGSIFGDPYFDELFLSDEEPAPDPKQAKADPPPEEAQIVETNERPIREFNYFYAEIIK